MSHFQKRLALLKQPPFLIYMIGFMCAALGNGLGYIALSWIVVSHHGGVTAMAILMACFWGPNVILGPLMGVLADRVSRKWMIAISNSVRAIIFIGFSVYLRYHINVNLIYLMTLATGVAFSAFFSCAFAFSRELVAQKDLMYANSTIDIIYESGNVIGMGMAGLLIAFSSIETVILINGITFVIAAISMLLIPKKALCHGGSRVTQKIQLRKDFQEGLSYLLQRKQLLCIYTIQILLLIIYLTAPLLLVPFSKTVLHASAEQFGLIESAASIGIIIGGLFMPWISERFGFFRVNLVFAITLCITFLSFGYNKIIFVAMGMYLMIGFCGAIWPLVITKAQHLTDINFQGRVQSTFNSLSGILMLSFYFLMDIISKHFGVAHLYFIEVVITAVAIIFLVRSKKILSKQDDSCE